MPGADERRPSAVDRPPASRVADELSQIEDRIGDDVSEQEMADAEAEAVERARQKGWDRPMDDV